MAVELARCAFSGYLYLALSRPLRRAESLSCQAKFAKEGPRGGQMRPPGPSGRLRESTAGPSATPTNLQQPSEAFGKLWGTRKLVKNRKNRYFGVPPGEPPGAPGRGPGQPARCPRVRGSPRVLAHTGVGPSQVLKDPSKAAKIG